MLCVKRCVQVQELGPGVLGCWGCKGLAWLYGDCGWLQLGNWNRLEGEAGGVRYKWERHRMGKVQRSGVRERGHNCLQHHHVRDG